MSKRGPTIALVHATLAALEPAVEGLEAAFPEATAWNLMDDRLIEEAAEAGCLTEKLRLRMIKLIQYALDEGASGVLLTCSMYGPVVESLRGDVAVPLLGADDALFDEVIHRRFADPLIIGSLQASVDDSLQRLGGLVRHAHQNANLHGRVVPQARRIVDDPRELASVLGDAITTNESTADVVILAQYSLAPAASELERILGVPVLSGPGLAAFKLRNAWLASQGNVS